MDKMVKIKDTQFCVKKMKIKIGQKIFDRPESSGDLNPRFSVIILPMIWIFMEGEGDEIKSRQES